MDTKHCTSCDTTKTRLEFNKNSSKKDGLAHSCRECTNKKAQERYQEDPKKQIEANNERRRKNRAFNKENVIKIKEATPCLDCGERHPSYIMDFDHVRGVKLGLVSEMVSNGVPWRHIDAEIAKCDLVCSNCHRYRTFSREGRIRTFIEEED
jgi:hypothetical protein